VPDKRFWNPLLRNFMPLWGIRETTEVAVLEVEFVKADVSPNELGWFFDDGTWSRSWMMLSKPFILWEAVNKVTYELNANKLTKTQLVNFFKLWVIGIGPINDE
jgi:hypothetical protein